MGILVFFTERSDHSTAFFSSQSSLPKTSERHPQPRSLYIAVSVLCESRISSINDGPGCSYNISVRLIFSFCEGRDIYTSIIPSESIAACSSPTGGSSHPFIHRLLPSNSSVNFCAISSSLAILSPSEFSVGRDGEVADEAPEANEGL